MATIPTETAVDMSAPLPAPVGTPGVVVPTVQVTPTQVRRPWRTVARSIFQALVAIATLVPFVVSGIYEGEGDYPAAIAQVLVVSGAITRVMALPQVEAFLRQFLPFLSAAPKPNQE